MNRIPYSESVRLLQEQCGRLHGASEKIPVRDALDRVLYSPVYSRRSNPSEALAAMDGIAVDFRATEEAPLTLTQHQWRRINTGETLPPDFNAVVRIEDVKWDGDRPVLEKPACFYQHVRSAAEDFASEDFLLPAGQHLNPPDLSLLLAAGVDAVDVYRSPIVAFIPTGSELVLNVAEAQQGMIPESNSAMIGGMIRDWGGIMRVLPPVPDREESLESTIREALAYSDVVVLSAGTSMGTRDLTSRVLQKMGTILFHGVAIHPARPVLLAQIGDVPVLGLPGYPSAACLASQLYLREILCSLSGRRPAIRREIYICAEDISPRNEDSFYRVQCFDVDGRVYVRKMQKGASSVIALSRMDGWMHVPPGSKITKRDAVRVDLIHDRVRNTIAIRGTDHPYARRLFDMLHSATPLHRVLFWSAPEEEALENIIERNSHMALLTTTPRRDLFPAFAHRLRDWMLRYRLFTRWMALLLRPGMPALTENARVAIPENSAALWEEFCSLQQLPPIRVFPVHASDFEVARALQAGFWDAAFADIGFSMQGMSCTGKIPQHFDLVVSDLHLETDPGIKKLMELAFSPEYEEWLGRRGAFDPVSRGLVQEAVE